MAGFKTAPSKKRMMFRKAKVLKTMPKTPAVKMVETEAAKMTKKTAKPGASATTSAVAQVHAQFPKIALAKGVARVVNDVFNQVNKELRLRRTPKKTSLAANSATGVETAVATSSIAALVVLLLIFAVMLWGISRSGQEMTADNTDRAASKVYFGFMVAFAILYVVFEAVAVALAADVANVVVNVTNGRSADTSDAVRVTTDFVGSSLMYVLGGLVGFPLFIMAVVALVRLGPNKK
jgi:uncharacterized membrane protein YjgN (DUF898 family)